MAWLWVRRSDASSPMGAPVPLPPQGLSLGRVADNQLVVRDAGVSRHHARVRLLDGNWLLEDLGSANGTWVGCERIQQHWLQEGDRFRVGETTLIFSTAPAQGATRSATGPQADASAAPLLGAPRRPILPFLALAGLLGLASCGAFLGGAVAFLYSETRRLDLVPSQIASILRNGWSHRLRPAALETPTTPAVDVTPAPGLRIVAERGALDQPRHFLARPLSRGEARRQLARLGQPELLALGGFEVDAGMTAEQRFNRPVRFLLDLDQMRVPAALRSGLQVVRVEPGGRVERLPVRLKGHAAEVEADHNAGFVLAWGPLGILLALAVAPLSSDWEKGAFSQHWYDEIEPYFHVCWPRAMAYRETPEVKRVMDILVERRRFHISKPVRPTDSNDADEYLMQRLVDFMNDPQVKACQSLTDDVDWKVAHLYPTKVALTVTALRHAAAYLWTERKFRHRSGKIDVWVQEPWSHGTEYALTIDDATSYPYIQVNGDKLPARTPVSPGQQAELDALEITMLHETFHVVQKEYFNATKYLNPGHLLPGGARYEWFNEATAPLLEEEARSHYLSRGWATTWETTFQEMVKYGQSPWGQFRLPLDATGKDESGTRQKGYAASRFLMALRDSYFAANKDAFLPRLMDTFGSFWTGPVEALVKTTSNSRVILGLDYLVFCERNTVEIANRDPNPASLSLGRAQPVGSWTTTGPLSAPGLRISWASLAAQDLAQAKLMLRPPSAGGERVAHAWAWSPASGRAMGFRTIKAWPFVETIRGAGLLVQRIEYDADAGKGSDSAVLGRGPAAATTALLLLPPRDPPRFRIDQEKLVLHVEVPPTPLWREQQVIEYRLRFHGVLPKGRPLPISLGKGKLEADIELTQLLGAADPGSSVLVQKLMAIVTLQDLQDMLAVSQFLQGAIGQASAIRVSYAEVVRTTSGGEDDPGIEGPESQVFEVPAEAQPGGAVASLEGTWKGQVMLVHHPVTLQSGVPGTLWLDNNPTYFRVAGSAQRGGRELAMLERVGNDYRPTGFSVYVYPLPGPKLWLTAPPCVLYPQGARRPAPRQSWWDHFFGNRNPG